MEEIEIKQFRQGMGFRPAPVETSMAGVIFDNGAVAYLTPAEEVQQAPSEKHLMKALQQEPGCVEVQIIHRRKKA